MITYPDLSSALPFGSDVRVRASRVTSWDWESRERMTVSLEDGTTVFISGMNVLFAAPPQAAVTYDATSSGLGVVGVSPRIDAAASATLVAMAVAKCAALGCGLPACGAAVSLVSGVPTITSMTCGAYQVWKWPAGVTEAEATALTAASAEVLVTSETEEDKVQRRLQSCGSKQTITRAASGGCKGWTCEHTMCGGINCKCSGGWDYWAVIFG